jgi:hypothetical protein
MLNRRAAQLLALALPFLAACGSDDTSTTGTDASATETSTGSPEASTADSASGVDGSHGGSDSSAATDASSATDSSSASDSSSTTDAAASDGAAAADSAAAVHACTSSGGTVGTSSCCLSAQDFPNTCGIGACSCAPGSSHTVQVCNCPGGCFDGTGCQ